MRLDCHTAISSCAARILETGTDIFFGKRKYSLKSKHNHSDGRDIDAAVATEPYKYNESIKHDSSLIYVLITVRKFGRSFRRIVSQAEKHMLQVIIKHSHD